MRVTYQKRKTPRALNLDVSEISKLVASIFRIKNTSIATAIQALNGVEAMLLEIVNWDKFNRRRKDIKTNIWFSVANDFLDRLDVLDFSNDQKIIWLYLLTCRAKSKTPQFKLSIRLAAFACQCDEKLLTDTIDRLQHLEMITSVRDAYVTRTQSVRDTSEICALDKIRLEKIRLEEIPQNADACSVAIKKVRKPKAPIDKNLRHPLMDLWNVHCGTLPTVVAMTKTRLPQCKKRLEDNPDLGYWEIVIKKIAACDWCNGNTGNSWRANFDYFLQDETNVKYLEGKYDNRSTNETNSSNHGLRVL